MLLLRKYIIKEILLYFIAIIFLLFFISTTNKFIGLLTQVASGKLPFNMACQGILLYTPELLGVLIPVSLFIATLFVISKLYADNEIAVLFISGLSWRFLIGTVIIIATITAGLTASLTLWLTPITVKMREAILSKGETLGIVNSIIPGRFQIVNDGKQVFYVGNLEDKNEENQIQDVFIATNTDNKADTLVITAKTGKVKTLEDQDGSFLVLQNGHRYAGVTGTLNFSVIDFAEYGKQLLPKNQEIPTNIHRLQNTSEIWRSNNPGENAEWQWRMAMPISVLILAVLAISLAKVSPRQGRFAKFLPAILLFIIYFNAMLLMRRLVSMGDFNNSIYGVWTVHMVFLVLALWLLLQSSGWLLYLRKKFLF
jgi:lipopolysaccharide export system permease protein